MAQENNTAREQTELEKLSQDALNQARRERKMIQDTCIAELAQCDTEIPEALEKQVQAEIASLQQAKENLSSAHKIASSTVDELSARAADVAKSLNRKWYRINPPSNTSVRGCRRYFSVRVRGITAACRSTSTGESACCIRCSGVRWASSGLRTSIRSWRSGF